MFHSMQKCILFCVVVFLSCAPAIADTNVQYIPLPSSVIYECGVSNTVRELNKSLAKYEHPLVFEENEQFVNLHRLPVQGNMWKVSEVLCGVSPYCLGYSAGVYKSPFSMRRSTFQTPSEDKVQLARKVFNNFMSRVYKSNKTKELFITLEYHPWEYEVVMVNAIHIIGKDQKKTKLEDYTWHESQTGTRINLGVWEKEIEDIQIDVEMLATKSLCEVILNRENKKASIDKGTELTVVTESEVNAAGEKLTYDKIKLVWHDDQQSAALRDKFKVEAEKRKESLYTIADYMTIDPAVTKKYCKYRIVYLDFAMETITDSSVSTIRRTTPFDHTIREYYQDKNRLEYSVICGEVTWENKSFSLIK